MAGESFLGTCSIHPGRRHQTRLQQSHICNSDRLSEIGWDDLAGSVGTGFFRVAAQHFINDKTSETNDNRKKNMYFLVGNSIFLQVARQPILTKK